jgi:hypothetical protein
MDRKFRQPSQYLLLQLLTGFFAAIVSSPEKLVDYRKTVAAARTFVDEFVALVACINAVAFTGLFR